MKKFSILLICIFTCLNAFSGVVSEEQALQKAQRFMQGKLFGQRKTLRRAPSVVKNNAYYIFNADNKNGFVIVSGDDRTVEILGYSDYGQLNEDDMPENLKIWLQGYQEQIASLRNNKPRKSSSNQRPAIDELIQTRWNQRWPYNTMCPMDGDNQCVTGCVATAMAQIMYYHRWPETYDWDNMLLDYLGESTKEQQNAVAKLMSDCGVAVDMNYSATASGANLTPECLKDIFGYSQTARFISHDDYTNSTWEDIIYEELAEGRPVYYRGAKEVCTASFNLTYVGHAFICDGYDGHGLFHINWGWGGMSNGYFVLSIADPSESGIGGSDAEGGYSFGQAAIIGIQPDNGIVSLPYVAASNYTCTPRVYNRTSSSESFTDVNLSASFNCYKTDFSGLLGFGLFKGSTLLEVLEGASECSIKINEKKQHSINTSFGAGLDDGKYYIRAIYKVDGSQEWSVCREFNYLSATIDGQSLTINELDKTTQKLKINSVVIDGEKKEGRLLTTLINITNEGETSVQNIKIAIGSTFITVPANLEPGETSDIKAEIRLKDNGEQNIVITCDGNQLWTEQLTIEECPEYDFSGTVTVDGMVMGRLLNQGFINGNTVKGTLKLTNNSNVPYDDDVIVRLSSKFPLREQLIHVVLGPGETKSFNYEISDLVNADYSFDILYYSRNGNEYLGGYLKHFTQDNTHLPTLIVGYDYFYDLSGSYTVNGIEETYRSEDGTELNGIIPYTTMAGTLSITNNSSKVYDDDVVLSFGKSEEYPNYSRNDTYHLTLNPGATTVIEFKYEDLEWEESETYTLTAHYNALSGNNTAVNAKNGVAFAHIKMFSNFALESNFIMKSHVANERKNYLKDNKLKFSIEVTNPHDYAFEKKILTSIILYKRETNSLKILNDDRQVEILPKGKITLDYEFDIDDNYYVEISSGYLADEQNMGSLGGGRWQFVDDSYIELGDINADGSVDNADLEPLMDIIANNPKDHVLNEPAYLFTSKGWDYSVADLVVLISKINGQMLLGEDYGPGYNHFVWVDNPKVRVDKDNVIPIKLSAVNKNYSAVQFVMSMSDGLRVKNDETGMPMIKFSNKRNTDHKVYCRWMENMNRYFVIIYSPTNQPLDASGDIANMTIEVDADFVQGKIQIDDQYFVEVGADAVNCYYNYLKSSVVEVEPPIIITAKNYTIEYGGELPIYDYSVEGGEIMGTPVVTCEATATSPVGVYPITIYKGSVLNDYVTYVAGTLTITKAPLNIAAGTYTKKQGEAMPEFTLTYTGFKNSETKDVLTKQAVVTCEATIASAPGEYPVTVSGAEAQNYDISYTNGKLIVTEADLVTITAKSYSRVYGEANPVFEYTTEGATLEGSPEITCEATATSPIGTYDIIVKQGTVANYNVAYVAGTLTITKAPLNIAAETYTKKQGEAMPEFTLIYTGFNNNETKDVLTKQAVVTCEATIASAPGEYPVIVSGAEAQNYDISYTNGKLIVTEADLVTITAKSYSRVYGEANPVFEYTTEGATLEGTPEITCEATATSPVGTYDIIVKQGTVANYNVAYVAGTLTITKAPLNIAAETYTKKQGEAMPEFTLTYTGFKNNETKDVLTKQAVVTCEATIASAPGEYPVTVSGAEAQNYDISYTNGKLIVTEADLVTITAKSYSRVYGEANPVFEYTTEGATLEGTPEITCEATATSPVGTYDIIVKQGTVANYNVAYVAGTLTITKAPLNIAAETYTKKQGEAMPEFTLTYSGFKNNETKDVLTTLPTVSCSATEASAPGEYPIIVSGAEAQNYNISYTNGKLIVTEADLVTITAKSYTREYGEENPTFEYTVEGAILEGVPEVTCEATATSPVGTYDIVVKQGTVTNYNVAYVAGTLTITKAPLAVTVENATREQGQENPAFVINYIGWKNGEDENVLITKPTATTEATIDSPVGTYTIVVSGGEAQNYQLSYNNGILSVTESTGIMGISVEHPADVYDMQGNKVRSKTTTLKGLAKGLYIVNGRKVTIK